MTAKRLTQSKESRRQKSAAPTRTDCRSLDDSIGIDDRCSRWPTAYQIHPGTAVGANFLGRSEESNRPDGVQGGNARSLPSGETVSSYIPEESLAQDGHKKGATTSNSYFGDSSSFEFVSSIRAGSQCQESGLLSFSV